MFAGLEECLKFIRDYQFHPTDIDYLRASLPSYIEGEFFDYLSTLNMNDVQVHAVPEGKATTKAKFQHFSFLRLRLGGLSSSPVDAN